MNAEVLEIAKGEDDATFRLSGDLDLSTAPMLLAAIDTSIGRGGDVVLDMSSLAFMDSSGVRVIVQAANRLAGRGRLVLRSPTASVRRVIEVTQIGRLENLDVL